MSFPDGQPTRVQPPAPQAPPPAKSGGDLDLRTLVITAAASALAAFICSKVWTPGTLASAAFTPVIVALFREALRRPTEVVASALPVPRRGTASSGSVRAAAPNDPTRAYGAGEYDEPTRATRPGATGDPTRVRPREQVGGPTRRPGAPTPPRPAGVEPVSVYGVKRPLRHRWRIAIITGLLGFVVAAVLITVPELVAGKSDPTIFPRSSKVSHKKHATPTTTTTTVTTTTQPTTTVTAPQTTTAETPTTDESPATTATTTSTQPTTTATTPTTTATTPTTPDATGGGAADSGAAATP